VRREIETRCDALEALADDVRATTEAVTRQQGRVEQLAVETTAQLQQREHRDLELEREMARLQSATVSVLKSETDALSARATEIEAASQRVQDTARAALERDATVERRFGAIESRLGALVDRAEVRREIGTRFDALEALAHEVRATTEAVTRQQGRVEQLAVETAARFQQREHRDLELGREMDSLRARATEIEVASRRMQDNARAALERDATAQQRLGAIESRLGALVDVAEVRREIETRCDALQAFAHEVRATTEAVHRQQGRVERFAAETTAQLQQREHRDLELEREMARLQSVQAFTESAWRRVWDADSIRSPGAAPRGQRSLLSLLGARNAAWRFERRWRVALAHLRRSWVVPRVAEAMANLRIPKTTVPITYVAVATVFTALALMSAFVLHSRGRTADLVGPPVVTPSAPVQSTVMPFLPSATSATRSSESSLDSATTVQRYASARQVASAEFETPPTPRATEFVGTLSIRSTPDKAEVHIDRERVGETPLVLRRVRAGSHAIWIEHEGYQRWTAGVNVLADERTQVTVTLQAEPAR